MTGDTEAPSPPKALKNAVDVIFDEVLYKLTQIDNLGLGRIVGEGTPPEPEPKRDVTILVPTETPRRTAIL